MGKNIRFTLTKKKIVGKPIKSDFSLQNGMFGGSRQFNEQSIQVEEERLQNQSLSFKSVE